MTLAKDTRVHALAGPLLALLLVSCGGALSREIAETRHIPASSGTPQVVRVVDLGDMSSIPARGLVPTDRSDGAFVIGELVLVEGEDFGKLPTISIGGRPCERMARTKSGGILTRIPIEVDAGPARVEVSHPDGNHSIEIEVQRHLALADGANVRMVAISAEGTMHAAASFPSHGVVDLEFGHDGQALYTLSADSLTVLAVAAKGGPAVRERRAMEHRSPHALVSRSGVPILALLHGAGIALFDTRVATSISESGAILLPNGAAAAVFSPDGKHLAAISTEGNALSLIRLGDSPSVVATLALLEGEPVHLLQDLAFSPSGDEIWVISGNNPSSVKAGLRPTQVLVVAVDNEALSFSRLAKIGVAQAPQEMAVSQRRAVMAAAAVRSTRQRAAMVLGAVSNELVLEGAKAENHQGQILHFDLDGNATVLATAPAVYSQMRLNHKQEHVYAATRHIEPGQRSLGITSASLSDGGSKYLRLSDDSEANLLKSIPFAIAP